MKVIILYDRSFPDEGGYAEYSVMSVLSEETFKKLFPGIVLDHCGVKTRITYDVYASKIEVQ